MANAEERETREETMRKSLGRRIVAIRRRQGISQAELARRLGVAGSRLSHWERGFHQPSLVQVVELAAALNAGLDELVLGKAPAEPDELGLTRKQADRLAVCLRTAMEVLRTEGLLEAKERRTGSLRPGAPEIRSGSPRHWR